MMLAKFSTAGMMGIPGLTQISPGTPGWVTDSSGCSVPQTTSAPANDTTGINPSTCTFNQSVDWADKLYVDKGNLNYKIVMNLCNSKGGNCVLAQNSTRVYSNNALNISGTKPVGSQGLNFGGPSIMNHPAMDVTVCYELEVPDIWGVGGPASSGPWCSDSHPMPPNPVNAECTVGGNSLDVNLGEIERDKISTVPGTGDNKHYLIPVECKNGDEIQMNLQFTYTPLSIGGQNVVKTSSEGLGVAIIYNDSVVSPLVDIPLTFTSGTNNLDLAFGAVHDSTVNIDDVPTGSFNASAVLILTML